MGSLRQADIRAALDLLHDWVTARTAEELEARAVAGLRKLVPCDALGWDQIDVARRTARAFGDPPDFYAGVDLGLLSRYLEQHPIVSRYAATGDGSAATISDLLSRHAFERLALYADFYRPLHVADQLAFAVRTGSVATAVAFNRSRRSFTARDREVLELVRPHLAAAHRNVEAWEVARARLAALERGLEVEGRGVVAVRGDQLVPLSAQAARMLRRWSSPEIPLPLPNGRSIVLEDEGTRLTLRRAEGDQAVLLLDERRTAPDAARVRELGLTAREAEILGLAARGLADARIAERLVVSVRTVEKHLENAYRKLGVTGRQRAVAAVMGRDTSRPGHPEAAGPRLR